MEPTDQPEPLPEPSSAPEPAPPQHTPTSEPITIDTEPPVAEAPPLPEEPMPLVAPTPKLAQALPPPPTTPSPDAATERPLNVTDALSYLDAVKMQFAEQPDVYNRFLDIMKDFKSQQIDTPGVIERVSTLFSGHPMLIQGFNTFLPVGYRIECSTDARDSRSLITVTTPSGTVTTAGAPRRSSPSRVVPTPAQMVARAAPPQLSRGRDVYTANAPVVTDVALEFIQQMKSRTDPETYKRFIDIMSGRSAEMTDDEQKHMYAEVEQLLQRDPDLYANFKVVAAEALHAPPFRPNRAMTPALAKNRTKERERDRYADPGPSVPAKRKRKVLEKDKEVPTSSSRMSAAKAKKARGHDREREAPQSSRHAPQTAPTQQRPPGKPDDAHFFERVKRTLDSRETYNEFLKLVNLFSQDFIDRARLVRESRTFLGDSELMAQWKEILGWDDRRERFGFPEDVAWTKPGGVLERPTRAELNVRYGSYRKLPDSEQSVLCSGRDEMCRSVLNDEWVSHPSWAAEDTGFSTHKKNVYEEALHRSEEERHEYDFHIEAIVRTIGMLEPLNNKIMQLSADEQRTFKLKPNLNGLGKAIHQRVIKKIYGREAGQEVVQAIQETPALAIPVVLTRLKQKEEEWKRAQKAWNTVWREVDARNYWKSLDYRGLAARQADKRATAPRGLVAQMEAAREEQIARRAAYIDPLYARTRPRHQLELAVDDMDALQDALKLTFGFLDRTAGQLPAPERRRVEAFLRNFVPLFFMRDAAAFNAGFVAQDTGDEGAGVVEEEASSSTRTGRARKSGGGSSGGDLRKRLLKSEQAKSSRKTRGQASASPAGSRRASPARSDAMDVDGPAGELIAAAKDPRRGAFFTNSSFYVLLRQLQILYSRLAFFKNAAAAMANEAGPSEQAKLTADPAISLVAEQLHSGSEGGLHPAHHYHLMLLQCERLFDNEIEQSVFEDQIRFMFGPKDAYQIFTVDKIIGSVIKQVQTLLSEPRTQELYELLKRERQLTGPTAQDYINYRKKAENVIGPDENLFRMDWLPDTTTMTIQLLGKDDANAEDPEVQSGRWEAYIRSFASVEPTASVPLSRVRRPFLRRSLGPAPKAGDKGKGKAKAKAEDMDIVASDKLEIRVCVKTYRFFYVAHTEEAFWRRSAPTAELVAGGRALRAMNARRAKWIEGLNQRNVNGAASTSASVSANVEAESGRSREGLA